MSVSSLSSPLMALCGNISPRSVISTTAAIADTIQPTRSASHTTWVSGRPSVLNCSASPRFRPSVAIWAANRSEEHTSELQSLMRISYAVFCLKKKNNTKSKITHENTEDNSNHIDYRDATNVHG